MNPQLNIQQSDFDALSVDDKTTILNSAIITTKLQIADQAKVSTQRASDLKSRLASLQAQLLVVNTPAV